MTLNLVILALLSSLLKAEYVLEYVSQISRHGARTPTTSAIDPFDTDWGVLERGDLTAVGMRQHYLIGKQFNRRYNKDSGTEGSLYSDTYNGYEVYVQSSNKRRTMQSAVSQLEGLFPTNKRDNLSEAQARQATPPSQYNVETAVELGERVLPENYQISPIIVYDLDSDPLLPDWCPAYDREVERIQQSEEYKQIPSEQLRENIARVLGLSLDRVDMRYIAHLENALTARLAYGKEIGELQNYYTQILQVDYQAYRLEMTSNAALLKVINTNYLEEVYSQFKSTIQTAKQGQRDSDQRLKFSFYSYHDDQQLQLCVGLGIDMKNASPPYASTLVMQLWHDQGKSAENCDSLGECFEQYYVKTKYNDEVALVPRNCKSTMSQNGEQACRVDEWWQFVKNEVIYTGTEKNKLCGIE